MNFFPCELHCHSKHSDGDFTVAQLLERAEENALDVIALTDHNTMSGYGEIKAEQEDKVIKGIEWTSFYGHMLVLGARCFVDWRTAKIDNIDEHIQCVKDANGIVGIAHPYDIGFPISIGGHWDFKVENWSNVDYIEIWHKACPSQKTSNQRSMAFWTYLLDKGEKIAPVSGRDWHRDEDDDPLYAVTYIGTSRTSLTAQDALSSLENGRTVVSLGPKFVVYISDDERIYNIGDTLERGFLNVFVQTDIECREKLCGKHKIIPQYIRIVANNGSIVHERPFEAGIVKASLSLQQSGWLRGELWGMVDGEFCSIAITGAFYIK